MAAKKNNRPKVRAPKRHWRVNQNAVTMDGSNKKRKNKKAARGRTYKESE